MVKKIKERIFPGSKSTEIADYELEHRLLARKSAAEGIVLLKNEKQILPLKQGKK